MSEAQQRPLSLAIIRRLLGYTRPYARLRNTLALLVVARSIQLPLVVWSMARVISGPIARRDASGTVLSVAGYLALAGLTELCFVYRSRLALRLGEAVVHDLRNEIYGHLLRMPLAFFSRTPVGRLIGRITSDIDVVRVGVQDVAFISTVQAGQAAISALLMIYYDWRLFLVVMVLVPGVWLLVRHVRGKLSQAYRDQQESFSRLTASLAEAVTGIREIQGFARESVSDAAFAAMAHRHAGVNMAAHRKASIVQPLLEWNGQLFLSIVLVVGGYQALGGGVSLAALIQFLFLSNALFSAIPNIGNQYNQALTAMAGAERVFALLDTPPDWQDPPDATPLGPPEAETPGRVELRGVTFAYEPGRPVIHDLSLTVPAGTTLAVVGHTGSGKSTLANLVSKLYLPAAGQVRLDGRDLRGVTSASLRRHVGCVTQDNFLFTGTVLENIRVGRADASDAEVRAAVAALDVSAVVEALPRGFATEVGEGGARLSLGERQVICFARAMLADPRILILDEATSAVDVLTEQRIQTALVRLLAGRTSIVIAHRLSTIRRADQIVVLDHGRIVEQGTHVSLLAAGGRYAQLWRELGG